MTSLVSLSSNFLEQLYALGVTHAFVSPGSRSTPLAMALASSSFETVVCLDERVGAYGALGCAVALGHPVLVITTSGTATAELRPAVTESFAAGVPLIVVTADRPLRLQSVGASQTIDQPSVLRDVTALSLTLELHGGTLEKTVKQAAVTLVSTAIASPKAPAPVHANIHFDEPLLTQRDAGGAQEVAASSAVMPLAFVRGAASKEQRARWFQGEGVVLCGMRSGLSASHVSELTNRAGWGVIADPFAGSATAGSHVLHYGDLVLREQAARNFLLPSTLIRAGVPAASRVVASTIAQWAERGSHVISVPSGVGVVDPEQVASEVAWVDLGQTLAELDQSPAASGAHDLAGSLSALELGVDTLLDRELGPGTDMALARALYRALGPKDWLMTAASMPLRLIEWFAGVTADAPTLHANRGANGIDGTVATFLGAASEVAGLPVLLTGDLSFLYDLTALIHLPRPRRGLILVLDNDGGAIFDHVPHAEWIPDAVQEKFFVTPHHRDLVSDLTGLGVGVERVCDVSGLRDLVRFARGEFVVGVFESERKESLEAFRAITAGVRECVSQTIENASQIG